MLDPTLCAYASPPIKSLLFGMIMALGLVLVTKAVLVPMPERAPRAPAAAEQPEAAATTPPVARTTARPRATAVPKGAAGSGPVKNQAEKETVDDLPVSTVDFGEPLVIYEKH